MEVRTCSMVQRVQDNMVMLVETFSPPPPPQASSDATALLIAALVLLYLTCTHRKARV